MNFVLKPAAEADLASHIEYLLEEFAYHAAERFPVAFGDAIESIRENPLAGAPFAAFRSWALPGFPNVRAYYLIQGGEIIVTRVLHTARNIHSILEQE